jgi:phage tail sheath protein FI
MATLRTPGVYVQEISKFPPSVAPVATAIPAFIGYTEKATDVSNGDLNMDPTRITSILEYETFFGFAQEEDSITVEVTTDDKIVVENLSPSIFKMYYSMQMYFANGGGPCYITSVGQYGTQEASPAVIISLGDLEDGLAKIGKEDEPTLLLFPDATSLTDSTNFYSINNSALAQCADLQDRFTIMDTYTNVSVVSDMVAFRAGIRSEKNYVKYGAAYYPYLKTIVDYAYDDALVEVSNNSAALAEAQIADIQSTIVTASLLGYCDDVLTGETNITGAATDADALVFKSALQTTLNNINSYLNGLKSKLEQMYAIGREETSDAGVISATDAIDTWIAVNLAGLLSSMTTRIDKLSLDNTKAKMLNTLQNGTTGVITIMGIALGPTSTVVDAIDILNGGAGEIDSLEAAFSAIPGGSSVDTLASLETTDNPLYYRIKDAISNTPVTLPPSSAMAGIYARVDNTSGVWKAPANVGVQYVIKPTIQISQEEQGDMNVTSTGKSVNAIRTFTGKGTLVWGARTLAGNDNEWRYISVRRFFNFVEESVSEASEQFVFEANDANTWVRVRGMIDNFLNLQWRAGALAGAKPNEAYYVRIGLGSTMTSQDILEGRMIVEIGMAAVRPAEFIVLRFSHKMQES